MLPLVLLTGTVACAQQPPAKRETNTGPRMPLELQIMSDSVVVDADASFTVPVRLRNTGTAPITLMFTSACSFELIVTNAAGDELARPTPLCLSVIREPTLEPGEVMEDSVAYTIGEPGAVRLAPGEYVLTPGLLATAEGRPTVRNTRLIVRARR